MENNLEYRMYGLVPYNISPIQQAIQFGHAVVEYGQMAKSYKDIEKTYNNWANNWKTFIILNGGTTNNNENTFGSLNKDLIELTFNDITLETFYEPDLNHALTAIVFLVDERVFDKKTYPDFVPLGLDDYEIWEDPSIIEDENKVKYDLWVESIGGIRNAFLREFLKGKRFA
jgi:hypothetical protein